MSVHSASSPRPLSLINTCGNCVNNSPCLDRPMQQLPSQHTFTYRNLESLSYVGHYSRGVDVWKSKSTKYTVRSYFTQNQLLFFLFKHSARRELPLSRRPIYLKEKWERVVELQNFLCIWPLFVMWFIVLCVLSEQGMELSWSLWSSTTSKSKSLQLTISRSVCARVAVGNPALGAHAQIFYSSYTYSLSRAFDKETQGHAYSLRIHYRLWKKKNILSSWLYRKKKKTYGIFLSRKWFLALYENANADVPVMSLFVCFPILITVGCWLAWRRTIVCHVFRTFYQK
jgi:hypothetical protein